MNPVGSARIFQATNSVYDTEARRAAIFDQKTANLNRIRGNESPAEVWDIYQEDRQLSLLQAWNETVEKVAWEIWEAQQERKRKEQARAAAN